ncbi:hypothetical protein B0T16DRAFT_413824 [Cercophora newfieldiana]|uniref:Uncharacterized protein n=1 Tax=Cercophora newfieldiana TaxID=92897 RepID=A0AA39Y615_9PEZI|nr:hypothetical protein B0T16DRAFT_413824 [Cercophora newfieldiana]
MFLATAAVQTYPASRLASRHYLSRLTRTVECVSLLQRELARQAPHTPRLAGCAGGRRVANGWYWLLENGVRRNPRNHLLLCVLLPRACSIAENILPAGLVVSSTN